MSGRLWQQPYVNLFKHFKISEWKKCTKEGDVTTVMDKTLKATAYRICGSVPAGNYIQFPKTSTQSLGLTGHYLYILFKPIATKYFVVHLDVATDDGIIVRISFSNLFKEFKSTSTWLQFPFISTPAPGTVENVTAATLPFESKVGIAPVSSRWTLLCLDLHYILSVYLNRKYAYLKTIRLCASMLVKNIFTSDTSYEPGVSMTVARKTGLLDRGFTPLPREMSFPSEDLEEWQRKYDYVKFPSDSSSGVSFRDVIPGKARSPSRGHHQSRLGALSPHQVCDVAGRPGISNMQERAYSAKDYSRNPVNARVALVDKLIAEQGAIKKQQKGTLPETDIDLSMDQSINNESVHIYAYPGKNVEIVEEIPKSKREKSSKRFSHGKEREKPIRYADIPTSASANSLQPDPILNLQKIVGIDGKHILWTRNGNNIVYPCHAVIVSMNAKTGKQSFLLGHNKKVSSLAFNGNATLLASAQTGDDAIIRIWKFSSKKCLAVFQSHINDPYCLSFSQSGSKVCAVGYDHHGKQRIETFWRHSNTNLMILLCTIVQETGHESAWIVSFKGALAVWDAGFIMNGHKVTLIAKAHCDVDIATVKICPFDDSKMISCGRNNLRVWKIKRGSLRSRSIDLGDQQNSEFTDIDFECIRRLVQDPSDRKLYACTKLGSILVINFKTLSIRKVLQLLSSAFTCIAVSDGFCATGSEDGFIRLWPLEFDGPFMEAEHAGGVNAVAISFDEILVSAITGMGNLGVLDISSKSYKTLIRSHVGNITSFSFENIRNHVATVSEDKSIKIWERASLNQLYDFRAPGESPCIVQFHPVKELLACGFESGCVRVFDIASTSQVAEHRHHRGKITGLLFTADGNHMHTCDSKGSLALYDASDGEFGLIRLLPNALARLDEYTANTIAMDNGGRRLACIGPSEFVITVYDARSLDELLRIDITSMANSANNTVIDSASILCYTPSHVGHLVVITTTGRMLKLDAKTGQLLTEVSNVHRGRVTGVAISPNGQYLATAGDKVIKIWDYHMRMDLNFQVFIGHSQPINDLKFTADGSQLFSIGECLFVWEFLGKRKKMEANRHAYKSPKKMIDFSQQDDEKQEADDEMDYKNRKDDEIYLAHPRKKIPQPTEYEPLNAKMSPIPQAKPEKKLDESLDISSDESKEMSTDEELGVIPLEEVPKSKTRTHPVVNDISPKPVATMETVISHHAPPTVMSHFKMREKISRLAEKRYTAPPQLAGLKLKSVVGYDGMGRNNMIWHPVTGLFAYSSGCIIVIEDLTTGSQRHLRYHTEDISTLAVHHDGQVIASASAPGPSSTKSQICIWEVNTGLCRKHIDHHKHAVIAMQYSRDDRFLVTIGNFHECSVAVWSTRDYSLLVTSFTMYPVHAVQWDPYTMNEFATVGQNGSVLFWLLDETKRQAVLNVHEAEVPEEVFRDGQDSTYDMTSLAYAGDSILYVTASNGVVTAWDTRKNSCFMHWKGDNAEILEITAKDGKLITGGLSKNLCLWSVSGVAGLRDPEEHQGGALGTNGLVMEDEMQLDGCIISAIFDSSLDMGVVGTIAGTIWYINWEERSSIRLVSGHMNQVNKLIFGGVDDSYMASCGSDGSMRLWNTESYEQTLQFLVLNQSCNCVAFRPAPQPSPVHTLSQDGRHPTTIHPSMTKLSRPSQCAAGYSDGTVRMFDFGSVEMTLKLQPHPVNVTAIAFSSDGRVIISGAEDGLLAISSPATGMTVRMLNDHKGAPITDLHVSTHKDHSYSLSSPMLWLAASADRRVSIWTADWSKDFCELVDWLTFPAPNFTPDGTIIKKTDEDYYSHFPPSLARFSPNDADTVVYTGYGMKKQISFYSLSQKKVVRAVSLTEWALSMDISPKGNLVAVGSKDRLVKLIDYKEGTFQDFIGHSDSTKIVQFSPSGRFLFTVGYTDILVWEVNV